MTRISLMAQMMMLLLLLLQQTAAVLLTLQHHLLPAMAVDQLHQSSKNLHLSLVALCNVQFVCVWHFSLCG